MSFLVLYSKDLVRRLLSLSESRDEVMDPRNHRKFSSNLMRMLACTGFACMSLLVEVGFAQDNECAAKFKRTREKINEQVVVQLEPQFARSELLVEYYLKHLRSSSITAKKLRELFKNTPQGERYPDGTDELRDAIVYESPELNQLIIENKAQVCPAGAQPLRVKHRRDYLHLLHSCEDGVRAIQYSFVGHLLDAPYVSACTTLVQGQMRIHGEILFVSGLDACVKLNLLTGEIERATKSWRYSAEGVIGAYSVFGETSAESYIRKQFFSDYPECTGAQPPSASNLQQAAPAIGQGSAGAVVN